MNASGDALTAVRLLRVIGFPGSFADWGLDCVCQMLESAGHEVEVTPLNDPLRAPGGRVIVLFGHGPALGLADAGSSRTIVFLDAPERALRDLVMRGFDTLDAAHMLTATLAPLPQILRTDGVLLVRRMPDLDPAAVQFEIARHIGGLPDETPPPPPFDMGEPIHPLKGQSLAVLRQALAPLAAIVLGASRDPMVWPLACFYAGDHPAEVAAPFIEVVGPARILFYGPYFNLPPGSWRADVQLILSVNMRNTKLVVDVFAGRELVRHAFKPGHAGLLQVSLPFMVESAEQDIEIRIALEEGAIEGYLGLKQAIIHPIEIKGQRA